MKPGTAGEKLRRRTQLVYSKGIWGNTSRDKKMKEDSFVSIFVRR